MRSTERPPTGEGCYTIEETRPKTSSRARDLHLMCGFTQISLSMEVALSATNRRTKNETGINLGLVKAIAHPYRVQALHIINREGVASPNEIAQEVGVEVGKISYHVRELVKFECIELVDTKQRRGATEHFYRANKKAAFNEEEWARIPESIRSSIVGMELAVTGTMLTESIADGSFERRPSRHHSLHEKMVDEQGWDEAMELLGDAADRLEKILEESCDRVKAEDRPAIPLAVSIVGFETASPGKW